MARRKRRKKPRRSQPRPSSDYQRSVRQADEVLAQNDVEIREDNWQELALEWVASEDPERSILTRYFAEHEGKLGVAWARELLRMEVYFQLNDTALIVAHYDHAFSRYPRCALVEMWVADRLFRHQGDFWRARRMYRYTIEHLPDHPKPYYEMGFMSFLLGDLPGALAWFDQAAQRATGSYTEVAARASYNRGAVRLLMDGDRQAVIADMQEALRYKRDYAQARQMLRGLRSKREMKWTPW